MADSNTQLAIIHDAAGPVTLAAARILVFALWLALILPDPIYMLAEMPIEIFDRLGVLYLIPWPVWEVLLTPIGLTIFKTLLATSLFLAALGIRPYHWIAWTAVALLVIHQGMVRGFGFINHKELALLYAAAILATFPAHEALALGRKTLSQSSQKIHAAGMQLLTLVPLIAYSAIALYRVSRSSPNIFISDSMLFYIGREAFKVGAPIGNLGEAVLIYPEVLVFINTPPRDHPALPDQVEGQHHPRTLQADAGQLHEAAGGGLPDHGRGHAPRADVAPLRVLPRLRR